MSEEVNELLEAFLSLCLEQRQLNSSKECSVDGASSVPVKEEELKASALELAQKLYIKAAELERSGDISKAMELYNRAYRLDPDITRHIDHDRVAAEISQKDLAELDNYNYYNPFGKLTLKNDPVDRELVTLITRAKLEKGQKVESGGTGALRIVFKSEPNYLEELPEDVLERILQHLGSIHLPSLEIASMASRGLFLASRQESLWRHLCQQQETKLFDSWRLQFILCPQFRTDGLYIAKITYFRQGYQESAISQPSHLVTYYRYLRFFPGKRLVMALVTTDKPKLVIEQMKEVDLFTLKAIKERIFKENAPRNRRRNQEASDAKPNLFLGTYWPFTARDRSFTLLLFDAHSKSPMRLKMTMELGDPGKGTPSHRTAKCIEYCGRVEEAEEGKKGERVDFDVNNWGKFYFSRVKSYF